MARIVSAYVSDELYKLVEEVVARYRVSKSAVIAAALEYALSSKDFHEFLKRYFERFGASTRSSGGGGDDESEGVSRQLQASPRSQTTESKPVSDDDIEPEVSNGCSDEEAMRLIQEACMDLVTIDEIREYLREKGCWVGYKRLLRLVTRLVVEGRIFEVAPRVFHITDDVPVSDVYRKIRDAFGGYVPRPITSRVLLRVSTRSIGGKR